MKNCRAVKLAACAVLLLGCPVNPSQPIVPTQGGIQDVLNRAIANCKPPASYELTISGKSDVVVFADVSASGDAIFKDASGRIITRAEADNRGVNTFRCIAPAASSMASATPGAAPTLTPSPSTSGSTAPSPSVAPSRQPEASPTPMADKWTEACTPPGVPFKISFYYGGDGNPVVTEGGTSGYVNIDQCGNNLYLPGHFHWYSANPNPGVIVDFEPNKVTAVTQAPGPMFYDSVDPDEIFETLYDAGKPKMETRIHIYPATDASSHYLIFAQTDKSHIAKIKMRLDGDKNSKLTLSGEFVLFSSR